MVRRRANPSFGGTPTDRKPRGRHSISNPPDNIDASCTVQNSSGDFFLPGRRRVLVVPKDNIGIACLPTADRLDNIAELTEYESSDEEVDMKTSFAALLNETINPETRQPKYSHNRRSSFPQAMVRGRAQINTTGIQGIRTNQSTSSSNGSEVVSNVNTSSERSRLCKRRDTIGLLWQETGKETLKETSKLKKPDSKCQGELGISNVRRPKDEPTKPRKPIIPRDNIGLGCKPLNKSAGRTSGLKLSSGHNYKTSSNPVERKNVLQARLPRENPRNDGGTTKNQIDTLRTVSKLSVLLLYIHFLLTYYLSFAKSHRYAEIFDSCPSQDVYD